MPNNFPPHQFLLMIDFPKYYTFLPLPRFLISSSSKRKRNSPLKEIIFPKKNVFSIVDPRSMTLFNPRINVKRDDRTTDGARFSHRGNGLRVNVFYQIPIPPPPSQEREIFIARYEGKPCGYIC